MRPVADLLGDIPVGTVLTDVPAEARLRFPRARQASVSPLPRAPLYTARAAVELTAHVVGHGVRPGRARGVGLLVLLAERGRALVRVVPGSGLKP